MPHHMYWTYGLCISADIDCPELPLYPHPDGTPDVTFRLLPPTESLTESLENGYFEVRNGYFRITIPGVAQYLVEQGSRISIEPLAKASPEEVRLFLLGSCMGALLYQRGLFPLHGSAIETRWGAMIFVGAQGAGKSTLAAEFHRRGYRLLSDDVCAVAEMSDRLDVLPALAHFRLCPDAYERLGNPGQARFDVDKFVVPMGEGYCPHPVALKAIHILADREENEPDFVLLRGFDRVQRLLENLYRPEYLKGQGTLHELMRMAGVIAGRSTMTMVMRRRDPNTIGEVATFLESAWTKHFGQGNEKE